MITNKWTECNLIDAAPDMLQALIVVYWKEKNGALRNILKCAIERATGMEIDDAIKEWK